ncbi:lysophospholipid acyltransferase family protein [Hyphobacterium sp.]|uniref:lysophospholipid acyltransferase family protein n=1 Tax=Hyphobacterium sp. TaxID=2004662 RepID=UPI00374A2B0F
MLRLLRQLLFLLIIRPIAVLIIGIDARGKNHLPLDGPAIIAANHNSHVDTLLLTCLFPVRQLDKIRPVAAADHFLKSTFSRWFFLNIIGILPIDRGRKNARQALDGCRTALSRGDILILFPEGTRGTAEEIGDFKSGISRLAEEFPNAPIIPVYLQGAGRVLPRGTKIPVPYTCSAIVGEAFTWTGSRQTFMDRLKSTIEILRADAPPLRWL